MNNINLLQEINNQILSLQFNFNNIKHKNFKSIKSTNIIKWKCNQQSLKEFIKISANLIKNIKKLINITNFNYSKKDFITIKTQLNLIKELINNLNNNHTHLDMLENYPNSIQQPYGKIHNKKVSIMQTKCFIKTNSGALRGLLKQIMERVLNIKLTM